MFGALVSIQVHANVCFFGFKKETLVYQFNYHVKL